MTETTVAVIYAALSKKAHDEESIASQSAKVRQRLVQLYGDDVVILGPFSDDGHSGSKKNRGPELERAIAAAVAAADQHGSAELWANTSARFARGTGKRNEARAVGELFYDLRRRGVALRTVEDDEFVTNEMLVGFASAQAAKYAADLSQSVTRAKRRQAERGEHLGGPMPLGYVKMPDGFPRINPDAAATVRRIFELAAQGVPDSHVARVVNAEGHRTREGNPFDRRAIQSIVCNAFYASRIVYEGETFAGKHPALIDGETFDGIHRQRAQRDRARPEQKVKGAPARRHLLSGLARCAACGSPMFSYTSPYRRKDASRARSYQCRAYRFSDGTCTAKPVDAEAIDTAVMEALADLLPDFDGWIRGIEDRHAQERQRLAQQVGRAEDDLDRQARAVEKHERRYRDLVARDDPKADLALEFVQEARKDLLAADTRLRATRDALDSIPAEAPRDRLLDFAISLRDAIRGKVAGATTVGQVNRALIEAFEGFHIYEPGIALPEGIGVTAGVAVEPVLRREVAAALLAESWPDAPADPVPRWPGWKPFANPTTPKLCGPEAYVVLSLRRVVHASEELPPHIFGFAPIGLSLSDFGSFLFGCLALSVLPFGHRWPISLGSPTAVRGGDALRRPGGFDDAPLVPGSRAVLPDEAASTKLRLALRFVFPRSYWRGSSHRAGGPTLVALRGALSIRWRR